MHIETPVESLLRRPPAPSQYLLALRFDVLFFLIPKNRGGVERLLLRRRRGDRRRLQHGTRTILDSTRATSRRNLIEFTIKLGNGKYFVISPIIESSGSTKPKGPKAKSQASCQESSKQMDFGFVPPCMLHLSQSVLAITTAATVAFLRLLRLFWWYLDEKVIKFVAWSKLEISTTGVRP